MFLLFNKTALYAFLSCLREIIGKDLKNLKKDLEKEVTNYEPESNDNNGFSKTNKA